MLAPMTDRTLQVEFPIQRPALLLAAGVSLAILWQLTQQQLKYPLLFVVGLGMGVSLYHASFGFASAYRRALKDKDISGVTAQLVMLAIAMVLFSPVLAEGNILGHGVSGAVAPVGVSMVLGAFLFGIGMQVAGGCGSGTLFTVGGGSARMLIVLVFFCLGGFQGSLDLGWWRQLPEVGGISLGQEIGWGIAVPLQLAVLVGIYLILRKFGGGNRRSLWFDGYHSIWEIIKGPWPLFLSAGLLALFNYLTLLIAGHPWSITWGFALWAAKAATLVGWDASASSFWSGGFAGNALMQPILRDNVSVMNIAIVIGAFCAASLAGKIKPTLTIPPMSILTAVIGGLLLGYGSRLAYGCNIGALFSGIASTSLHGWVWAIAAIIGNAAGLKLMLFISR